MNNKGQAAMEFLMTYGWAILVVIAAIGALAYFGVLNNQSVLPDRTLFSPPIQNVDNAVIDLNGQNVAIAFKNNKNVDITIPRTGTFTSAQCQGTPAIINITDKTQTEIAETTRISTGNDFIVTWRCIPVSGSKSGSKFKADATFDYINVETGQTMKNQGTIEGKFS